MYKAFDCYCKELKSIMKYDGIFHWKDIYGNLNKIQTKNKQLELWCIQKGWKLIRINETTYKRKPEVIQEILELIRSYKVNKLYYSTEKMHCK